MRLFSKEDILPSIRAADSLSNLPPGVSSNALVCSLVNVCCASACFKKSFASGNLAKRSFLNDSEQISKLSLE